MSKKSLNYTFKVNKLIGQLHNIDTASAFDESYVDEDISAIDRFAQKTKELNRLQGKFVTASNSEKETISNLLILGYVSGVESYLREIIRRIITLDKSSTESCLEQAVSFGAATTYSGEHLPEALLEKYTFISSNSIKEALKGLLGLKNSFPTNVESSLKAYDVVCQMRHCIVHRYGRLGSRNAIKLGLEEHCACLEKPLRIQFPELQNIINTCHAVVYDLNNTLFSRIISRTVIERSVDWQWNLTKDKKNFKRYFELFIATDEAAPERIDLKTAYNEFRDAATVFQGID